MVAWGGEGLEAGPLKGEGPGGGADELAEVFPVQKLGLLDVEGSEKEAGQPLLEEGLRRGDGLREAAEGFSKEEESGVIVVPGFAGFQVQKKGVSLLDKPGFAPAVAENDESGTSGF